MRRTIDMSKPLPTLPPNTFYVLSRNQGVMDDRGNVYAFDSAPVTLPAAERTPALPDPGLSAQALGYIEAEENWLAQQGHEHFAALYINGDGNVIGATRYDEGTVHQEGAEIVHQINVNVSEVLREAERLKAAGVWTCHNHPGGTHQPSQADNTLTVALREALHRRNIRLLASHIVPGTPQALTEADPLLETDWDRRQREDERLWHCYGGRPSWAR
jgi:hypothetical protein